MFCELLLGFSPHVNEENAFRMSINISKFNMKVQCGKKLVQHWILVCCFSLSAHVVYVQHVCCFSWRTSNLDVDQRFMFFLFFFEMSKNCVSYISCMKSYYP